MLTFAAPWALALFAVGGLIAVLYFLRTRFHRQPVSSVFLWKEFIRSNEGGARLRRRSVTLLLLQLAVAALVALALARPEVATVPQPPGTLYVLDTSASMAAREAGGTRLEHAARALLDDAARQNGPVAVLAGTRSFQDDRAVLAGFLAQVRADDGEFREDEAAARIRAWTAGRAWHGVLVSDGGVDRGGSALAAAFGGDLRALDFAGEAPNVGIIDLRVGGGAAKFTLFSGFAVPRTVTLALTGGLETVRRVETLVPGVSELSWPLSEVQIGLWEARLEGENDALEADDSFRFSLAAARPIRVRREGPPDPFLAAAFPGAVDEDGSGPWDIVVTGGPEPSVASGAVIQFGVPSGGTVTAGPEVSGAVAGTAPGHALSRWVAWDELRLNGARGLIVPPGASVLAEADGWPVAAAWSEHGQRRLALGFDAGTSNVGLTAVLPVLLRNFRQEVLPQETNPLATTLRAGRTAVLAGSDRWHAEDGLDAVRREGRWELTPQRAGVFRWTDGLASGIIAANIAATESDTGPRVVPLGPPVPAVGAGLPSPVPLSWLFVLAALAVLVAEWRWWNGRFDPRTSPRAAWLRGATAAALALAWAGPGLPWPTQARNVVLLIDVSDSQGPALAERERQAALKYLGALNADDRAALVVFGTQPRVLTDLVSPPQARAALEAAVWDVAGTDTDLSAALATGAALLRGREGSGLQVLFSDGRATRGGALDQLEISPYPVYAVPFGRPSAGVAADGLDLPPARAGEPARVRWSGWSDAPRTVRVELAVDGRVVERRTAALAAGPSIQDFTLTADAGTRRVDVRFDGLPAADAAGLLQVEGAAAVLVVQGPEASPALASALTRQGLTVRTAVPAALPGSEDGYHGLAAVVFDNVPGLTAIQERALKTWVSNGGGLLVIGGASSLGRGGYFSSGLEELLPVSTDGRRRLQFTRTRLLFVVDHSGSMSEPVGPVTKIEAAVAGVARTLRDLSPQDEVGILQFDSSASWVLPFTPVSNRAAIVEALGSFTQGGGTELTSALEEVVQVFNAPAPVKRHVVLLTDGQTGVDDAFFSSFTDAMRDAEVSLTVLGIGDQVNEPLLRSLASATGGVYYRASGPDIPELLHGEAVRVTRDQVQEGRFAVLERDAAPALALGSPPPPVLGYLVTRAKPLARVGWVISRPELDPLYADWRYGAGRVAVFAADSGRRWLAPWSGMPEYNRFFGQAVKSLSVPASGNLEAAVTVSASVARITVEAREAGRVRSGASLTVTRGGVFPMRETAPGHYEASVPLAEAGLAVFSVTDRTRPDRATAWAWTPSGAETARGGVDWVALSRFTSATGGRLEAADQPSPPRVWAWASVGLADALLLLALGLFVVELARRSLSMVPVRQAVERAAAWWRDQKRPWVRDEAVLPRSDAEAERRTRDAYRYLAQRRKANP